MANDRQQVVRAYEKHAQFLNDEVFSVSEDTGGTAILVSGYERSGHEGQTDIFLTEAERLQAEITQKGQAAEVIICTSEDPVFDVVTDPTTVSIITIGNGNFSEFWVPRKRGVLHKPERVDWIKLSQASKHLKLGTFAHRACGHYKRRLNLPLGLFTVSDATNLSGAIGNMVEDEAPNESDFRPIFKVPRFDSASSLYDLGTQRFRSKLHH